MSTDRITIKLLHPTNSEESLTAAVHPSATPAYLIQRMIHTNFISPPSRASQYALSNAQTGQQLLENMTLQQAGVGDGATLAVHHSTSGAAAASER
jgi:hypothetical protein